jgi:hypothetical protein
MHRYVAAAQNAYYKAITQLTKLQKERAAFELEEIGFVSYPRESALIGCARPSLADLVRGRELTM